VSEQALSGRDTIAHALRGPTAVAMMVAAGIYVLLLVLAGRLLNDPDTYWQIAAGRWIAAHRAWPVSDPFSFTMAGEPWIAFEWGSELALAAAHAAGGWPGVVVLTAAAGALAFGLLTWFLIRELAPLPAIGLVLAAFVLAAPHLLARPHVLVLPVTIAWIGTLVRAADHGSAPPFRLLPLLALWANLHGSVCVGLALAAPIALDAVMNAAPARRASLIRAWALFGVLAIIAATFTPYGPRILLMPLQTLGLGEALSVISEWQPQDFARPGPFEIVLLMAIGGALYRGVRLPPMRILLVLGLVHLALAQSRHADLLAVLAPLFLAHALRRYVGAAAPAQDDGPPIRGGLAVVAAAVVAAAAIGLAAVRNVEPSAQTTPAAAIAATDLGHAGRVLNSYGFGGYLIHAGIPPFIDGRGELFGGSLILRHHRALTLQNLPDLLRLLDDYKIAATLLEPGTPAIALLDRLDGWERVYADDVAVVHKRRSGQAAATGSTETLRAGVE
jgi:hypothetical protein